MSCTELSFTQTSTLLGSSGISINITVPAVYPCTNIQLRYRSSDAVIQDWFDYTVLQNTSTTLSFPIPPNDPPICYIDVRLNQCCPDLPDPDGPEPPLPPGDDPPLPPSNPDDPPCALIAESYETECNGSELPISPYRRPIDSSVTTPYNEIVIPKKVKLTIEHNSCSDIKATLCTVRCPTIPDDPPPQGSCPCSFIPWVDIYSLPQLKIGRQPWGVPIDIDFSCRYERRPQFTSSNYTKIEAYLSSAYRATPFIDGIGYDMSSVNTSTLVKVHTCNTAAQLRAWIVDHFRFFTLKHSSSPKQISFGWPYNDLYWTPYDYCISNLKFTPENGVVYVMIVPC